MNLKKRESITAYIFALPSIIGFLLFFYIPFIISLVYCFTQGVGDIEYVGFQNFVDLFQNDAFILAFKNTLIFNAVSVPLVMIISLGITLILNSKIKKGSFFRTVLTFPLIIPLASVALVWQIFFRQTGVVNGVLLKFGIMGPDWLKTKWSFYILILLYVWKNCGYNMIIFLAGLNNVPKEYYEAASIDGCGKINMFFKITLPLILPTIFFVFIISIINSLRVYREAYLLSGQYPDPSIYMLQHFMNNNFTNLNYQRLSTASVIVFILVAVLVYSLFKLQKKYEA
ncbi:TPA: sugar ABC transporter permease [Clostridium botulinum]|uniref:Sugar ABC transporter permease n=1 Tax=Clostridium botulinum B str. Osaka05 TaxID=1407017 RepID=A0A0S6TXW8_CLOBO|nr:sugar ABC transporter permease [Clostridium botulinum]MBO0526167.1 sugar ABC transporter permease [Clostridium botulinum]MBO0527970.1 sugar ABC transporter permease [Clostridium botulinum]MBO0531088.1 sugar ABC transporter permease [Clostridium botulinum]MBO0534764.1 sugar ABC transporter permease [Clostridium botulinum]MBO0538019.1 sugar ABC transporter permease [Clostridium botulinum]